MKIIKKVLILILIITLIIFGLYYDSTHNAPKRFLVRYESLSSTRIPKSLDKIKILYFSDLYYGNFMNNERLDQLVDKINSINADIVIFGGDLIDNTYSINSEEINYLIEKLKSIKAPLGKFSVYGDFDINNYEQSNNIYFNSDFELINNKSIKLRNKSNDSINLIGLNNEYSNDVNVDNAFSNVNNIAYNIVVSHTPDTVNKVIDKNVDLFLSAHSLGGQINYIFTSFYKPPYTEVYFKGKHLINNKFNIDISNGVGTYKKDVRFLSNAEIIVYTLNNKEFVENK